MREDDQDLIEYDEWHTSLAADHDRNSYAEWQEDQIAIAEAEQSELVAGVDYDEGCCDLCGRSDPHDHDAEEYGFIQGDYDPTTIIEAALQPVAVYGTLRPGGGFLSDLWTDLGTADERPFVVLGFRLTTHGSFPFALPTGNADDSIVVTLIRPHDAAAAEAMYARMDRAEGVPHLYRRTVVYAFDVTGPEAHRAFMYQPARPDDYADFEPIPSGDWLTYRAEEQSQW